MYTACFSAVRGSSGLPAPRSLARICSRLQVTEHSWQCSRALSAVPGAAGSNGNSGNSVLDKVRNIGIIAHIDAGKTTTTERMLYYSGTIAAMGEVHDGDTVMDFMKQERERGITIASAAISFPWRGHSVNLIDTPGHVDFTVEVERTLRVLDGAVVILDAVSGVEPQSETVWRQADRHRLPRIVYVNKMDRAGADVSKAMNMLRTKFGTVPLPVHLPITCSTGGGVTGIVDLVTMEMLEWENGGGDAIRCEIMDPAVLDQAVERRETLVESLAEIDDEVAEIYLEKGSAGVTVDQLKKGLRRTTLASSGLVVMCGSSYKNKGTQELLDAIVDYLPSPLERPMSLATDTKGTTRELKCDPSGPLCAMIFKITHDSQRNPLIFTRVFSGTLTAKSAVLNATKGVKDRIGRMFVMSASRTQDVDRLLAGQIGAVQGLKSAQTGDTINRAGSKPLVLKGIDISEPVFFCSIEPSSGAMTKPLEDALQCIQREDPSLRVSTDSETGQTLVSGMGELHLEIIHDRILQDFKVEADLGKVSVAYRESIYGASGQITSAVDKVVGGKSQHASITVSIDRLPSMLDNDNGLLPQNMQNEITIDLPESDLPEAALELVKGGIQGGLASGSLLGSPLIGVSVSVTDASVTLGTANSVLSSCAYKSVTEAIQAAGPCLLEPMMDVTVRVNEDNVGQVLSDLTASRRAQISSVDADAGQTSSKAVKTLVPLSEMLGYTTSLRSMTQGTGSFSMSIGGYGQFDERTQQDVLQRLRGY